MHSVVCAVVEMASGIFVMSQYCIEMTEQVEVIFSTVTILVL